jgi:hypothetical protein
MLPSKMARAVEGRKADQGTPRRAPALEVAVSSNGGSKPLNLKRTQPRRGTPFPNEQDVGSRKQEPAFLA